MAGSSDSGGGGRGKDVVSGSPKGWWAQVQVVQVKDENPKLRKGRDAGKWTYASQTH